MDWFLYDNGLRHERVKPKHLQLNFYILYQIIIFFRMAKQEKMRMEENYYAPCYVEVSWGIQMIKRLDVVLY